MIRRRIALQLACAAAVLAAALPARRTEATEIVQIPVDAVLDARPVSTLTNGALVPWTVGIDQDDGFMTAAAAKSLHQTGAALPDDGTFAADTHHPTVVLHFSNAASATAPQARSVSGVSSFAFDVPPASYETLFLFLTSSYGDAKLEVTFQYADGTSAKTAFTMPDWGTGAALPAPPPTYFNLIGGLHKWTKPGASVDTPTHALAGVALSLDSGKTLARVAIAKLSAPERLTFWGATGVATSRPDAGADAPVEAGADAPIEAGVDAPVDASVDVAPEGEGGATDTASTSPDADAGERDARADERPDATAGTPADAPSNVDAAPRPHGSSAAGCEAAGERGAPIGHGAFALLGAWALAAWRGRRHPVA